MMLCDRRRALMMQPTNDSTIYGNRLSWVQGSIDSTGVETSNNYAIRTANFISISEKTLTFLRPIANVNDNKYYSYVCQYDINHTFISRNLLIGESSDAANVELHSSCAYIRLILGHSSSTAILTLPSEGAAVAISVSGLLIRSNLLVLDGIMNTASGHDQSAITWHDISGNNYDAYKNTNASDPVWGGNYIRFDGTNNKGLYIDHNFFSGRTTASIELVLEIMGNGSRYMSSTYYRGMVLNFMNSNHAAGVQIYTYNTGGISSFVGASSSMGYSATNDAPIYVCWTFNGSEVKRYLNGTLAQTASIAYSNHTDKSTVRIGYEWGSSSLQFTSFPDIKLYRVGIDSTAFSADTVADRYIKFKARFGLL